METISSLDHAYVWHPFTQMKNHVPIPISRAKGVYLYGEDGSSFIDGISSWWVNLHGHSHPYISDKITAQMAQLAHVQFAGFTHAPAVQLASRLVNILPCAMSKIFYTDNGACAVEAAIKMALQYWYNKKQPKKKIVCLRGGYHGDTFGAMSSSGRNEFNRPFWSHLFEVIAIDVPLPGFEEASLLQLKEAAAQGDVACFIFEPLILGTGGMIIYPAMGLNALLQCCKEYDVLTIADEVMTGFGRTGTLFACQQLQVEVDFILLSKGLTGGFLPLALVACTEKIYDAFLGDGLERAFLHGHSYTANPLACASALASLDLLLMPSCTAQMEMIASSHRIFCQKCVSLPALARCETIGTILALEYKVEERSYFHSLGQRLYKFFLDKGILLRPLGNVIYVMPPYCITENELQYIYTQIESTLEGSL